MKTLTWERVAVFLLTGVLSLSCFIGKGYADRVDKLEHEANARDVHEARMNELLTYMKSDLDEVKRDVKKLLTEVK